MILVPAIFVLPAAIAVLLAVLGLLAFAEWHAVNR